MQNYNFTQQEVENHLNGMADVKDLIYKIIDGTFPLPDRINPEPVSGIMKRQIEHLNIMLGIGDIVDSGADLTSFTNAIAAGNQWLQNNQ